MIPALNDYIVTLYIRSSQIKDYTALQKKKNSSNIFEEFLNFNLLYEQKKTNHLALISHINI